MILLRKIGSSCGGRFFFLLYLDYLGGGKATREYLNSVFPALFVHAGVAVAPCFAAIIIPAVNARVAGDTKLLPVDVTGHDLLPLFPVQRLAQIGQRAPLFGRHLFVGVHSLPQVLGDLEATATLGRAAVPAGGFLGVTNWSLSHGILLRKIWSFGCAKETFLIC